MRWLRFPRVLGLIVCLYLLGMAAVFGYLSSESLRFVRGATEVTGSVIAMEPRPPVGATQSPRTATYAPKVSYVVDGKTYTYTAAHGTYRPRVRIGDSVQVLYDPQHPEQARLRGEGRVMIPLVTAGFAGSALLVAVVLVKTRNVGARARPRPRAPAALGTPDLSANR